MRRNPESLACDRPLAYTDQVSMNQNLDGEDLRHANFKGATLTGSSFRNADLRDAVFYKTDLENCDFTGAKLDGANFAFANVVGAVFENCSLDRALLFDPDDIDVTQVFAPKESTLGGIAFLSADQHEASDPLQRVKSHDIAHYFELKTTLLGIDLYCSFDTILTQDVDTLGSAIYAISNEANYKNIWAYTSLGFDKRGFQLSFKGMDLRKSCFADVEFILREGKWVMRYGGVDFTSANLECADLSGGQFSFHTFNDADLSGSLCIGSIFTRAKMESVCLDASDISGANFEGADLTSAKLRNVTMDENTIIFSNTEIRSGARPNKRKGTIVSSNTEITCIRPMTIIVNRHFRSFVPTKDLVSKALGRPVSNEEYQMVGGSIEYRKQIFVYFIENNTNFTCIQN